MKVSYGQGENPVPLGSIEFSLPLPLRPLFFFFFRMYSLVCFLPFSIFPGNLSVLLNSPLFLPKVWRSLWLLALPFFFRGKEVYTFFSNTQSPFFRGFFFFLPDRSPRQKRESPFPLMAFPPLCGDNCFLFDYAPWSFLAWRLPFLILQANVLFSRMDASPSPWAPPLFPSSTLRDTPDM